MKRAPLLPLAAVGCRGGYKFLGYDVGALLAKADVVIVIDSVVPWMPRNHQPRKDAKVIHISADPLETRYPFREVEADLLAGMK